MLPCSVNPVLTLKALILSINRDFPMATFDQISPTEIVKVASSYRYDASELMPLEQHLWSRITTYGSGFGHKMAEHLNRTSVNIGTFLLTADYSRQLAENIAQANRFHDIGKTLQSPDLYNRPEKPSDHIKAERTKHPELTTRALEEALEKFPQFRSHPHVQLIDCIGRNHHERINGIGPMRLKGSEIGEIMEIIGIFDTVDGKSLPRGNEPVSRQEQEKRVAHALREMTGMSVYTDRPEKHAGEFSRDLLMQAIQYFQDDMSVWVLPRPQGQHQILAMT
jgi:response regulator RpfG family c-di-GMP phosphodiesterase